MFAFLFFARVQVEYDALHAIWVPWTRESVSWLSLCSHTTLWERPSSTRDTTAEELELYAGTRQRYIKERWSTPKLATQQHLYLSDDADRALRDGLSLFLPRFKDRPFAQRRLCWYTDTPKGDSIVDYNPEFENLFLATGGTTIASRCAPADLSLSIRNIPRAYNI